MNKQPLLTHSLSQDISYRKHHRIHSLIYIAQNMITWFTPFLKMQITITIQFFITTNLPVTCEKFVNIPIFFYS